MIAASEIMPGNKQSLPVSNRVNPSSVETVAPDIPDSLSADLENKAIDDNEGTSNNFLSYTPKHANIL